MGQWRSRGGSGVGLLLGGELKARRRNRGTDYDQPEEAEDLHRVRWDTETANWSQRMEAFTSRLENVHHEQYCL